MVTPGPEPEAVVAQVRLTCLRPTGEVAERLNAPVSKTGMGLSVHRGFESPPLRSSARFSSVSRPNYGSRTVTAGTARGSTQASVGPTLRDFVPSTFPPDVAEFVYIEPPIGELRHALESRYRSFVGEKSMFTRRSAGRQAIIAGHGSRHPFQEVLA